MMSFKLVPILGISKTLRLSVDFIFAANHRIRCDFPVPEVPKTGTKAKLESF